MSFYYLKENEVLTNVQKCQSGKWSLKMQKGGNGDKISMPRGGGGRLASHWNVGWNVVALEQIKQPSNKE